MINTPRLRVVIGALGMLLPWIVALLVLLDGEAQIGFPPPSISFTWYTNACTPFMIILGAAGILLFCYSGYDWVDDVMCTAAAICALGICLFPCAASVEEYGSTTGTFLTPMELSGVLHAVCAGGFFILLALMSLFRFTKSSQEVKDFRKKARNVIYIVCGVGILASLALLVFADNRIWLAEMFLLSFFGVSWITKANCIPFLFADKKEKTKAE